MLPVIAIVGRPNVGKSTLFNVLTKSRDALVADFPGVTRDRQYGVGRVGDHPYLIVDTGGIAEPDDAEMAEMTDQQVMQGIKEASHVFFMLDARAGLTPGDEEISKLLRELEVPVTLVVNKTDHLDPDIACSEFYQLGLGQPVAVAAIRKQGVKALMEDVLKNIPQPDGAEEAEAGVKIAIVGRPNVGKSTLINRLLGEERVVVLDRPGTTRDSIFIPYERQGVQYTLIDTAGVRRRAKVTDAIEKFSIIKTMQAIDKAHVVMVVMDAQEGISDQDMRLIGLVLESGQAIIIAVNKWDELPEDKKKKMREDIDRRLPFLSFARRYFISALHGSGVGKLYHAIDEAYAASAREITTGQLTRALEIATQEHQPPLVRGRRIRLRFAHIGQHHPMQIIIHGKQVDDLPGSYKRFLAAFFRKRFDLVGVPLIIRFINDSNPYAKKSGK